jgi:ribosome-associated heat shock protein Hsp15
MKDDNRTDSTLTSAPRLDKWLWAARFFKTRSLAADAIAGGKVDVNGERAKRSRPVRLGDQVRVRSGQFEHHVVVKKLSQSRGNATIAATLFEETPASLAARQTLAAQLRALATSGLESGRPTKKERRDHARFLDRQGRDVD